MPETRSARHRRPTGKVAAGVRLGLRGVAALLAVAALCVSAYAWATVRDFTSGIQRGADLPEVVQPLPGKSGSVAPKRDIDGKDENILLLGNDSIAGATPAQVAALGTTTDRDDSATDTMMIMHIPADGSKATIVSFPRDTWVDIPGFGTAKLNAAYVDAYSEAINAGQSKLQATNAGILLTAATLTSLTGLHIDHYVQINLLGFYNISEAIGPINVCLNAPQQDPDSNINQPAGWHPIVGQQALAFVRQRHGLPNEDLDRIKRQQYFLSAVFKKATSAGMLVDLPKLKSVLNAVKGTLFADPSLDVLKFIQQFQDIAAGNIQMSTIPIVTADGHEDGQSVVEIDPQQVQQFIASLVGAPVDPKLAGAKAASPAQTPVAVLNETDQQLLATKNAALLKGYGFPATVGDTSSTVAATQIQYPDGMQAQAKAVARYVPHATLVLTPGLKQVTLVLGGNGVQVTVPGAVQSAPKTTAPTPPEGVTTAQQNAAGCIN